MPSVHAAADSPEVLARVKEGLELVEMLAKQLRRQMGTRIDLNDLRSAGQEGLLKAACSFDDTHGVPFKRWANLRIRGAMIDALRTSGGMSRRAHEHMRAIEAADQVQGVYLEEDAAKPTASAEDADKRLNTYLTTMATAIAVGLLRSSDSAVGEHVRDSAKNAEEEASDKELSQIMLTEIHRLPESERELLVHHYYRGLTLEEAGKKLGLSKSWASRLHARAMESLGKYLRARVPEEAHAR